MKKLLMLFLLLGSISFFTCLHADDDVLKNELGGLTQRLQILNQKLRDIQLQPQEDVNKFFKAVQTNDVDLLRALLQQKKVDPNVRSALGKTGLMFAAALDFDGIIQLLLDAGADIDVQDAEGYTALIYSSMGGREKATKRLLDNNADPNKQNKFGQTALMLTISYGWDSIAREILRHNPNLNLQDIGGFTALMKAVQKGNKDIVQALIDKGADTSIINKKTLSALALARGKKEIFDILEKAIK